MEELQHALDSQFFIKKQILMWLQLYSSYSWISGFCPLYIFTNISSEASSNFTAFFQLRLLASISYFVSQMASVMFKATAFTCGDAQHICKGRNFAVSQPEFHQKSLFQLFIFSFMQPEYIPYRGSLHQDGFTNFQFSHHGFTRFQLLTQCCSLPQFLSLLSIRPQKEVW